MKEFGSAREFYRARIISLDTQDVEKLDWSEEILYQQPKRKKINPKTKYKLEILEIDKNNALAKYFLKSHEDAEKKLNGIFEDINTLTKNEFDNKYLKDS